MFAWIPIATGLLTALAVRRSIFPGDRFDDLARTLLLAVTLWGAYLALVTEVLSLFGALRFGPLLAAWTLPIPVLLMGLRRSRPIETSRAEETPMVPLAIWEAVALAASLAAVVITGIIAAVSAPINWDSMTYHLPRMMQWAQNETVAHYATHEPRQLYLSPWADLVGTHFYILGGGDRAARLVQWLAMTGSLLAVSTIAGQLGAGRGGRILSVLVAATIPMGLLQAVSTQTDYAVSFHVAVAVCFLSSANRSKSPYLSGAALATGLAILTKGTAYMALAPFLAAFTWRIAKTQGPAAWRPLALFAGIVIALNTGHLTRNAILFGDPLQPRGLGEYHRYGNEAHGASVTLSNVARFAALHLTVPDPDLLEPSYDKIRDLHRFLSVSPDDPRTTWPGKRFEPPLEIIHEDKSGNFLHTILILFCCLAICLPRVRQQLPDLARHLLLIAAGFLLFAALLKWTPWSSRLHLPFFVLAAPAIGTLLTHHTPRLAALPALVLIAGAVPFILQNPLRPLLGLENIFRQTAREQVFEANPRLGDFYVEAARRLSIQDCQHLGLDMPPDAWEYPLWKVMRGTTPPVRLSVVNAGNVSQRLVDDTFEPCAVLCLRCDPQNHERYRARFGNPVLNATNDQPHQPNHLLFLE